MNENNENNENKSKTYFNIVAVRNDGKIRHMGELTIAVKSRGINSERKDAIVWSWADARDIGPSAGVPLSNAWLSNLAAIRIGDVSFPMIVAGEPIENRERFNIGSLLLVHGSGSATVSCAPAFDFSGKRVGLKLKLNATYAVSGGSSAGVAFPENDDDWSDDK